MDRSRSLAEASIMTLSQHRDQASAGEKALQLDPLETPVTEKSLQALSEQDASSKILPQPFKHSGWRSQRQRIHDVLVAVEASGWRSRRFATCGAQAWVLRHKDQDSLFRIVLTCCHDRFCVPCARARAFNIRQNLAKHTAGKTLRFLTLTLKHTDQPLDQQLDRLYRAFRALRATSLWRERVRGGVAFLEVKLSESDKKWHPHLHCLIDSTFLPKHQISSAWLDATGDSEIIDIRLVRDTAEVDKYITKYVTKPTSPNVLRDAVRLAEVIKALMHRRMFITFGQCRNWKLTEAADPSKWTLLYHEVQLREKANDGDPFAQELLDRIAAFIYGQDEQEFVLELSILSQPPPAATIDAQLRLF